MQNNNKCCKDCSERKPGCHAECARYAEFKERLEKIKLERRKEYNKFNRYIYGIDKNQNKLYNKSRLIEGACVVQRTLQGKTCRLHCGVVPCTSTLLAGGDIHIQILEDR